jgi:hypothetical protein
LTDKTHTGAKSTPTAAVKKATDVEPHQGGWVPAHYADTLMKDNARAIGRPELSDAPGENGLENIGHSTRYGNARALDHHELSPHPSDSDRLSRENQEKELSKLREKADKPESDAVVL